jgi:hypothetical protein
VRPHPPVAKLPLADSNGMLKRKVTRTNWSDETNRKLLTAAIDEWTEKRDRFFDENDMPRSLSQYSNVVDIPYQTLIKYVNHGRIVGVAAGRKALITSEASSLIADCVARADRGNDGRTQSEVIDMVQETLPMLSRKQAADAWLRTAKKRHVDVIKPLSLVAQATTTKRCMITISQQYRWFTTYNSALDELRRHNTGVCNKTGKSFGEVIEHFILGGDETCIMASQGKTRIIGATGKKKHEKNTSDSRVSISMYRLGSAGDNTGPTIFLMAGTKKREGYTDAFLEKYGAAKGSTLIMTPTAYMTEDAWLAMTPSLIAGINAMPYIADNPQWKKLEVLDGFGPHTSSLQAMQLQYVNGSIGLDQ